MRKMRTVQDRVVIVPILNEVQGNQIRLFFFKIKIHAPTENKSIHLSVKCFYIQLFVITNHMFPATSSLCTSCTRSETITFMLTMFKRGIHDFAFTEKNYEANLTVAIGTSLPPENIESWYHGRKRIHGIRNGN